MKIPGNPADLLARQRLQTTTWTSLMQPGKAGAVGRRESLTQPWEKASVRGSNKIFASEHKKLIQTRDCESKNISKRCCVARKATNTRGYM